MAQKLLTVDFGDQYSGIATVGYKLLDNTGAEVLARTTSGVFAIGGGAYGVLATVSDGFEGIAYWDTVNGGGVNAHEKVDLSVEELVDQLIEACVDAHGEPGQGAPPVS